MKRPALMISTAFAIVLVAALAATASQGSPQEGTNADSRSEVPSPGAGTPSFDPRSYQEKVVGPLTQVLVLGVPHLSGAPDDFDPGVLEPLLERLQAFAPDVIAIENLSGESLFAMQAYQAVYPGVAQMFGARALALADDARGHAGIATLPDAEAAARAALDELGPDPAPAERRRLALLFLASGDPNSALVQWWRLPEPERAPAEDFPATMVEALDAFGAARNETRQIAARLAARRSLERVYPMDDHSSVDVVMPVLEVLVEALQADAEVGERLDHPDFVRLGTATQRMDTPDRTLAAIRELNRPEAGVMDAYSQWQIMLDREMPQDAGRVRMAEWEARNLRMAANIREASASAPGGRVLVVVGSAHKPWLDAYMGLMSDMRVVDAQAVLR